MSDEVIKSGHCVCRSITLWICGPQMKTFRHCSDWGKVKLGHHSFIDLYDVSVSLKTQSNICQKLLSLYSISKPLQDWNRKPTNPDYCNFKVWILMLFVVLKGQRCSQNLFINKTIFFPFYSNTGKAYRTMWKKWTFTSSVAFLSCILWKVFNFFFFFDWSRLTKVVNLLSAVIHKVNYILMDEQYGNIYTHG